MAFEYADRKLLELLHDHLHEIMRSITLMGKGMDALSAAVDSNANATDALSDEVVEAIEWIKAHAVDTNDDKLAELAARLEEKNTKANRAKEDLDKATKDAAGDVHAAGM